MNETIIDLLKNLVEEISKETTKQKEERKVIQKNIEDLENDHCDLIYDFEQKIKQLEKRIEDFEYDVKELQISNME